MRNFWEWIAYIFENYLLVPLEKLRFLEELNWNYSNSINWLFLFIGLVAAIYWIRQLNLFDQRGEEDKTITAHSFL
ncbi:MAG: uracil phosphoribosyltransferase [Flavobacteriaceae bacterium]|nr:uracil phosphoribosyltransferase [Flavobacteriaceae bacterium]MCY4254165.1 uracil phosphoribosyltransferase [Flavobacteriaceae bacterium]